MITLDPHPLLDAVAFVTRFPAPLGDMPTPEPLLALLRPGAVAPISPGDDVRAAVRDLLRLGGFKPTGRSKPASEYLIRASADGALGSINLAVDVCNIVSLHSGLPISVVDLSRASAPFRLGVAAPETRYVFNASGQIIDIGGLLSLFDAEGPCAGPVKDSQRTKTSAETTSTLSVIWGTTGLPGHAAAAFKWYRALLTEAGAEVNQALTP